MLKSNESLEKQDVVHKIFSPSTKIDYLKHLIILLYETVYWIYADPLTNVNNELPLVEKLINISDLKDLRQMVRVEFGSISLHDMVFNVWTLLHNTQEIKTPYIITIFGFIVSEPECLKVFIECNAYENAEDLHESVVKLRQLIKTLDNRMKFVIKQTTMLSKKHITTMCFDLIEIIIDEALVAC